MASVSSVNGNSMSSIYGNRNVISGLASGMDTESMIENAVSGIKNKITGLQQQRTTWQWKQEAYRGIIDKLVKFSNKYTSFASSTNLFSASFFNSAVNTTTSGKYSDAISATGKTASDVKINAATLATRTEYSVGGDALGVDSAKPPTITSENIFDLQNGKVHMSSLTGEMTFTYGTKDITIEFTEADLKTLEDPSLQSNEDKYNAVGALINKKLAGQTVSLGSGKTAAASDLIKVTVDDSTGEIRFNDKKMAGNNVSISKATGSLEEYFGLENAADDQPNRIKVDLTKPFSKEVLLKDYLSEERKMDITLDGKKKTITLPKYDATAGMTEQDYVDQLNTTLKDTFGTYKDASGNVVNKLAVSRDSNGSLNFESQKGSTFSITGEVSGKLGMGEFATSYINTGTTLGDMGLFNGLGTQTSYEVKASDVKTDATTGAMTHKDTGAALMQDTDGKYFLANDDGTKKANLEGKSHEVTDDLVRANKDGTFTHRQTGADVMKYDDGKFYLAAKDGSKMETYEFKMNGTVVGEYSKDTSLDTVIANINSNTKVGVNVVYSRTTNQFQFNATETGALGKVEFESPLAEKMFGTKDANGADITQAKVEKGVDATVNMTVNGNTYDVTRGDNTFDIDGLQVTINEAFSATKNADGTYKADEVVSFTSKTDSKKVTETIKTMIDDYNEVMKEIKDQYSTVPPQNSRGDKYKPLTDEDKASMTESAVKAYEDKAKEGLLFADNDLASLYEKMRTVFSPSGENGTALRAMGITTEYSASEGTTVKLDEDKLKSMLESNPDAVKDAFVKSKGNGAESDGIMQKLKTNLDAYAKTTGTKGILINKSGSSLAPTSINDNYMQKMLDGVDKEIDRWTDKMSLSIDSYTRKFSQLEQLIAKMNSQSQSLMGMMGGG